MEGKPTNIAPTQDDEYQTTAWALTELGGKHTPIKINRPKVFANQVNFEILYAGICHTDVHIGENTFGNTVYPFVAGHEILGRVLEIGEGVTKVKVGDIVGVGCFIDSCLDCPSCDAGDENYCYKGQTGTYNGDKKHGRVGGNQVTKS